MPIPRSQRSSVDFNTSGISAGLDYGFGRFVAGIGVGYGRDTSRMGSNGTRSDADAYNVATYASYRPFGNWFVDGLAGFGELRFSSQRYVVDDTAFVHGDRDGRQVFASLTTSYEYRLRALILSPYARINAAWVSLGAFKQDRRIRRRAELFVTVGGFLYLGARATQPLPDSHRLGRYYPRLRIEYHHDFAGTGAIVLQYADLLGPTYRLATAPRGTRPHDFRRRNRSDDPRRPQARLRLSI